MAKADKWRRIADKYRGMPDNFGLREYTVSVIVSAFDNDQLDGGRVEAKPIPILINGKHSPKVRFPSQRELALSMAGVGSCIVGPFTPYYGSGGIPRGYLDGSNVERDCSLLQFLVTGPNFPTGCLHRLSKFQVDRALQVVLELMPVEQRSL